MRHTVLRSHVPQASYSDQQVQEEATSSLRVPLVHRASVLQSLHLRLLGSFQCVYGDTSVTSMDGPRLQSLLAYLVLHAGVPQARIRLAALLWPDSPEGQAHTNLRNLLCKLRKLLPSIDAFVRVERHTILWRNDGPWQMDVQDFEGMVTRAEQAKREGDLIALHLALEQAIALYQGELLPGCYDAWVLPERERLFQVYLDMLECLLHLREQEGDTQGAIRVAQRILREDPLHEAVYRLLMCLYAKGGNRSAAIRTYHTCAAALERELGLEPAFATRQVYERLVQAESFQPIVTVKRSASALEASHALHSVKLV